MDKEYIAKIKALNEKIKKYPKGYISTKNIGGRIYYYHQWSENGKKMSKYISEEDLFELDALIKERQDLEKELKSIKLGNSNVFTLMHLNAEVIDLFFDEEGYLKSFDNIYDISHLPIGVVNEKGNLLFDKLRNWWNERSIPLSRSGIRKITEELNIQNTQQLLLKCYGLSLSDQYWVKPKEKDISWEDINYFHNDFSEDIGELLFTGKLNKKDVDLSSPDNTSIGNLKKRWKIVNDKRILIKGASNPFRQEPYNEVIAHRVAEILHIPSISYSLIYIDDYPYSECEDFVKDDIDLVPAYQIKDVIKRNNNDSLYAHLIKCGEKLGVKGFKDFINQMIVLDFIIANEDRHLNNFGVIRNAKTLEFVSPAPIFDSGASFGYNKIDADIKAFKDIEAKPFKDDPIEQLKLVKDFFWLKKDKLIYIKDNIYSWFKEYESKYLTESRIKAICESVKSRIDFIINNYMK